MSSSSTTASSSTTTSKSDSADTSTTTYSSSDKNSSSKSTSTSTSFVQISKQRRTELIRRLLHPVLYYLEFDVQDDVNNIHNLINKEMIFEENFDSNDGNNNDNNDNSNNTFMGSTGCLSISGGCRAIVPSSSEGDDINDGDYTSSSSSKLSSFLQLEFPSESLTLHWECDRSFNCRIKCLAPSGTIIYSSPSSSPSSDAMNCTNMTTATDSTYSTNRQRIIVGQVDVFSWTLSVKHFPNDQVISEWNIDQVVIMNRSAHSTNFNGGLQFDNLCISGHLQQFQNTEIDNDDDDDKNVRNKYVYELAPHATMKCSQVRRQEQQHIKTKLNDEKKSSSSDGVVPLDTFSLNQMIWQSPPFGTYPNDPWTGTTRGGSGGVDEDSSGGRDLFTLSPPVSFHNIGDLLEYCYQNIQQQQESAHSENQNNDISSNGGMIDLDQLSFETSTQRGSANKKHGKDDVLHDGGDDDEYGDGFNRPTPKELEETSKTMMQTIGDSIAVTAGCAISHARFATPLGAVVALASVGVKDGVIAAAQKGKLARNNNRNNTARQQQQEEDANNDDRNDINTNNDATTVSTVSVLPPPEETNVVHDKYKFGDVTRGIIASVNERIEKNHQEEEMDEYQVEEHNRYMKQKKQQKQQLNLNGANIRASSGGSSVFENDMNADGIIMNDDDDDDGAYNHFNDNMTTEQRKQQERLQRAASKKTTFGREKERLKREGVIYNITNPNDEKLVQQQTQQPPKGSDGAYDDDDVQNSKELYLIENKKERYAGVVGSSAGAAIGLTLIGGPIGLMAGSMIAGSASRRAVRGESLISSSSKENGDDDSDDERNSNKSTNRSSRSGQEQQQQKQNDDGGYKFGDVTRGILARGKEARNGTAHGNGTANTNASSGYKFGDFSRGLYSSFKGK